MLDVLEKKHNVFFNEQQLQAVNSIDKATLLLAVPGSGKTTVIISRIGNMIYNHSIPPEQILTLTFSKAAAADMKERFVRFFGQEYSQSLQFKTIHSFCYSVFFKFVNSVSNQRYEVISSNFKLLKNIYKELQNEYPGDEIINDLSTKIGFCKNMMYKKEQIKSVKVPGCDFCKIYEAYESFKKKNFQIDYDDMLTYTYMIFKKRKDVLGKYQDMYRYVNVDEAQDTSRIQHEIIRLLVGDKGNIFMVGDEDQSIYGFRAAFPQALLDFEKTYKNATVLLMEENYRSTKTIVGSANNFIKQNRKRFDKDMFCKKKFGSFIEEIKVEDTASQYAVLAKALKKEKNLKDIAIIYRNNDSAVPLVDVFDRYDIPFYLRENKPGLFSYFVLYDILSYMKLALDLTDVRAFEQIYYKLGLGISREMLERVKREPDTNVFDVVLDIKRDSTYHCKRIEKTLYGFNSLRKLNPYSAIEFIEQRLNYEKFLEKLSKNGFSKDLLNQRMNTIKLIAAKTKSIEEFFERIDFIEQKMQNSSGNREGVVLTTAHSSKGLEFEKVYLIDVIENQFPSSESVIMAAKKKDYTAFEEEVRLFYVAVTRAKSDLKIITARTLNGDSIRKSRFVKEILEFRVTPKKVKEIKAETIKEKRERVFDFDLSLLKKGVKVSHEKFGTGVVKSLSDDVLTVSFPNSVSKRFSISYCKENRLLEIV